jgi:response regulator of citrate/malate metabolism
MIKVLIVEDDPMVAYLNEKYVSVFPEFEIIDKVGNGEEALKVLKNKKCDLVILDVYMPKMDGLEVLRQIRREFIKVDVIFITAAKEHEVIDRALKLGAIDYLVKPFEFERLKESLKNYLARHEVMRNKGIINQKDIDFLTKVDTSIKHELPKGLQERTLKKIMDVLGNNKDTYLSADEVAELAGISRVTVRRYLEYQESVGVLECETKYGTVGRPSYVYKILN